MLDKVFVIVVTYKGHEWYDQCFRSLRASTVPVRVIAVDNASRDGSVEFIREHFPEVHLICSEVNLGFGRANNLGIRYALDNECDYVFLLNQDAWVEPDTLRSLIEVHKKNIDYGVLSPMHLNKEKNHLNFMMEEGHGKMELVSDLYLGIVRDVYDISYVNAAGWLIPRTTLMKIGGFCPAIFHYGEDDDYLNRLKYHKIKVGLCPAARIVHDSKHRVQDAALYFQKANEEQMDLYLDITKDIDLKAIVHRAYLRGLLCLIKGNKEKAKTLWKKGSFIRNHKEEIERCRSFHKLIQPNWL